jgi:predicted porin
MRSPFLAQGSGNGISAACYGVTPSSAVARTRINKPPDSRNPMIQLETFKMKKSLIVLTALGLSSAAMAQSSVTLYGIGDLAVGQARMIGDSRTKMYGTNVNGAASRLGVRGHEDLGSGLYAEFNFETGINPTDGSSLAPSFWGRGATVSLGNPAWGEFLFGRQLGPAFYGMQTWELLAMSNHSVAINTYGWGGSWQTAYNNAMIQYTTPKFGGFQVKLAYSPKANNEGQCASGAATCTAPFDGSKWDGNITYVQGPFSAGLTFNKISHGGTKTNWSLGARYNFGSFIVAASYNQASAASPTGRPIAANPPAGTPVRTRAGFSLGGTGIFGPISITLDLTYDTRQGNGGLTKTTCGAAPTIANCAANGAIPGVYENGQVKKFTNAMMEGRYYLSKRTFLYADYLRVDSTNNWGLGMRYNF